MKKTLALLFLIMGIGFSQTVYKTLGTWDSQGVPSYLDPVHDNFSPEFLASITNSLPEYKNVSVHHPQYLAGNAQTNVVLTSLAEVWVSFVWEGAGYRNAIGFYTYNVNTPPTSINSILNSMTIIFPNASLPGAGGNLTAGSRVKIGTFPANTVVGWFVVANGFGTTIGTNSGVGIYFSNDTLNPELTAEYRRHVVSLNDPFTNRIVVGFEDLKRIANGGDHDFNDVLFAVTTNPVDAVNLTNMVLIDNPNAGTLADLKLEKSIDNPQANHGEFVNSIVKVTNLGPGAADNIKVTDILPSGLDYVSYTATKGTYTSTDGLWRITSLLNGESATLTIKTKVNLYSHTYDLGAASDFNVFVLNDINQPSSDTEGKVAVGNNAYLSNYSVGYMLPLSSDTADVLVVGNGLTYISGSVFGGNVVYKNYSNLPLNTVSIVNGTLRQDDVIDFNGAKPYLQNLSSMLKTYTVNGLTEFEWGGLKLSGENPVLNVFSVDGAQLSQANSFRVEVPNGSVVLVNISGTSVTWTGGHEVVGTAINNVLYNFPDAIYLHVHNIDVGGSILAPKAELDFPTGLISGQVIANNVSGIGQFNYRMFLGSIPLDNKIINNASITSLTQIDLVSSNNSASATLIAGGATNPNANNSSIVTWGQNAALVNQGLIWTMFYSNTDLYIGTWGGKILRSQDNGTTWNHLNGDMNVGYIWTIKVAPNGTIFAGSELGVYKSSDNGATWVQTNLVNTDVRALAIDENNMVYAGLWGGGVKKSTDMGLSWREMNTGLLSLNIHALAYKQNVGLFAGTFGEGVLKSLDGGDHWTKCNIPFEQIWSLGIASDNKIYAGTYGGGVYKSANGGDTWQTFNTGLSAKHIYAITFDSNNNTYVSAWGAGVFMISNAKDFWKPIGMEGFNVSSIAISPSNYIFAGTANGAVYSGPISLTGTEGEVNVVEEYSLSQNYPNPFNPSTTIKYQLKNQGFVSLRIYDMLGKEVTTLINEEQPSGSYSVEFNATGLASGVYIYQLKSSDFVSTKKLILMK